METLRRATSQIESYWRTKREEGPLVQYLERLAKKIPKIKEPEDFDPVKESLTELREKSARSKKIEELFQKTFAAIKEREQKIAEEAIPKILENLDEELQENPFDLLPKKLKPTLTALCAKLNRDQNIEHNLFTAPTPLNSCWEQRSFPEKSYEPKNREALSALIDEFLAALNSKINRLEKEKRLLKSLIICLSAQCEAWDRIEAKLSLFYRQRGRWRNLYKAIGISHQNRQESDSSSAAGSRIE